MAILHLTEVDDRSSKPATPMSTVSSSTSSTSSLPGHTDSTFSPSPASKTQAGIGIGIASSIAVAICIVIIVWVFLLWQRRKQAESHRRPQEGRGNDHAACNNARTGSPQNLVENADAMFTSVPLRHLRLKNGQVVPRQGAEPVTLANPYEVTTGPPTRNDSHQWSGDGGLVKKPMMWNKGHRDRSGQRVRQWLDGTLDVDLEGRDTDDRGRGSGDVGGNGKQDREEAGCTFLVD